MNGARSARVFGCLTVVRIEYNKALPAGGVGQGRICDCEHETSDDDLSLKNSLQIVKFLLRNFGVTEQHQTAAFAGVFHR